MRYEIISLKWIEDLIAGGCAAIDGSQKYYDENV